MLSENILQKYFSTGKQAKIDFRDENNERYSYSVLIGTWNRNIVTMFFNMGEVYQNIKFGTPLLLSCFDPETKKDVYFTSSVVRFNAGFPQSLEIDMPQEYVHSPAPKTTVNSRRRFFRCDVDLPFVYYSEENLKQRGKVTNLSASGLYARVTNFDFVQQSAIIFCELELPDVSDKLVIKSQIVRINQLSDSRSKVGVALDFMDVSEHIQNHITKYLFRRQRELIKLKQIHIGH